VEQRRYAHQVVQACALQVGLMRQAALLGQDEVVLDCVDL
jgi:hypothetical protein